MGRGLIYTICIPIFISNLPCTVFFGTTIADKTWITNSFGSNRTNIFIVNTFADSWKYHSTFIKRKIKTSKVAMEINDVTGFFLSFLPALSYMLTFSVTTNTVEGINGRNMGDIFHKSLTGVRWESPFSFYCFLPVKDKGKDHRCLLCRWSLLFPASTCVCVCVLSSFFLFSTKPKNGSCTQAYAANLF